MSKDGKGKNEPDVRIGRVERDKTLTVLRLHFEAERITYEEFQDRMETALKAVTAGDLAKLTADLPSPGPVPLPMEVRQHPMPARRAIPSEVIFWVMILVAISVALFAAGGR